MGRLERDIFAGDGFAHVDLAGRQGNAQITEGTLHRVTAPVARLCLEHGSQRADRQILFGHPVRRLAGPDTPCRDETTGYVGYIVDADLGRWVVPTHRVAVRSTLLFSEPDFKSPQPLPIPMGALLCIDGKDGRYGRTQEGRFAVLEHLEPVSDTHADLAATASVLLGTPYLWGGNSSFGIDCSGLIQACCQRAGLPCPGDSDQQLAQLGVALPQAASIARNDLLFWRGHVALAYDDQTLVHANAHTMCVALESVEEALRRIEHSDGPLLAHKRLSQ